MRKDQMTVCALEFLSETAKFRLSPRFEDVRGMITGRGFDPQQTILFWCEHARDFDMLIRLALPSGEIVEAILRKEAPAGRYTSIVEWKTVPAAAEDEDDLLARSILTSREATALFSKAVESYHYFQTFCERL